MDNIALAKLVEKIKRQTTHPDTLTLCEEPSAVMGDGHPTPIR
jgi:hypothetical protein